MCGTEFTMISWPLPIGDVAPPPPEIPILEATIPHPVIVLIAGVGLSLAVAFAGIRWKKQGKPGRMMPTLVLAAVLGIGTCGAAVWAAGEWGAYQNRIDGWEGGGPIEERLARAADVRPPGESQPAEAPVAPPQDDDPIAPAEDRAEQPEK